MGVRTSNRAVCNARGSLLALALLAGPGPSLLLGQCPDGTPPPCAGARAPLPVLVVMPFESRSRDTADSYLAVTLTEDVTAALAATHTVRLVSAGARRRGGEYVLAASVRPVAHFVRLTARLERGGVIVWTTSLDRPIAQDAGIADTVAARVLTRLGARRTTSARTPRPVDPAAYDVYLRGRYYSIRRTEADLGRAAVLLGQATARDSTFALAWAALARTLHVAFVWRLSLPGIPPESLVARELDAAERALLNDSTSAEIWIARSQVAEDVDQTSRAATLHALRRAIALDSLSPTAWNEYGFALFELGDTAEAAAALRRAIRIDPGHLQAMTSLGLHEYWLRQYDSAAIWADSLVASDPTFLSGRRLAGSIALARGRVAEAEAQFGAARTVGPGPERIWAIAGLACAAVARGDSAAARTLMAEAVGLTTTERPALHSAVFVAWGYGALGERERALAWLERYRPRGDLHFQAHLRGDAPLDPLRGEPRFQGLLSHQ